MLAVGQAWILDNSHAKFAQYMAEFNKSYDTPEEFDMRYFNFLRSQNTIDEHNSQGKSYYLGHNAQSDWSETERKARLGDKTFVSPSA